MQGPNSRLQLLSFDSLLLQAIPSPPPPPTHPPRHAAADGRDVNDNTAVAWVERLQGDVAALSQRLDVDVRIASGGGRMAVTMDRYESDWRVVQRGYYAHVLGEAPHRFKDPVQGVRELKKGNTVSGGWRRLVHAGQRVAHILKGLDGGLLGVWQSPSHVRSAGHHALVAAGAHTPLQTSTSRPGSWWARTASRVSSGPAALQ